MSSLPNTVRKPSVTPLPSRMKLAAVKQSKQDERPRWLLYAVEGIGKSTFGSHAPSPIFLAAESGLSHLDVPMFPQPTRFEEVLEAIDELIQTEHSYKTLVVDTLDWLEPLVWEYVCRKDGSANIEAVGGGYQKGYTIALDAWRELLGRLERLHKTKGMEIGLLAHARVQNFSNPSGPDYSRFQAAVNPKAYDVLKQWVDVVLFGTYEEVYSPDAGKKKGKIKGVSTGKRELFTERTAAYDAKNRRGLPPVLPFSYASFSEALEAGQAGDAAEILTECERLLEAIKPEADLEKRIRTVLAENATDKSVLVESLNKLRVMASEAGVE